MNILIIKTGALGDVVRTSFIAQALKDKYQKHDPKIFWITAKNAMPLFINNIYVDKVIQQESKEKIRKFNFDITLNLEEEESLCKFASSLNSKKLIGFIFKNNKIVPSQTAKEWFDMSILGKSSENDILKKKNKKTHRKIMSEIIQLKDTKKYEPFLRLTSNQRKIANNFLRIHNLSRSSIIIGINTGAADRWPKSLSIKKTAKLIDKLYKKYNTHILLFGGPQEIERNREIIRISKSPIISTGSGNNLVEFPALISVCNLFITSDSLGLHIALALKRKTICLVGPTSYTELDMYDLGEKVIAKSKFVCTYRHAPKNIMDKIDISQIIKKSNNFLSNKITLLITSFKEPLIGKAIESALNQNTNYDYDVLVSAPDNETLDIVRKYQKKNKNLKILKDPGKGKSFALNLIFKKLKSDILILTDGDVQISLNTVEEISNLFLNPEIGCITGRPIPIEDRNTKFGYWANFLFEAAHKIRKKAFESNSFIECSGYLFAFRKKFIKKIPLDVAEDSVIPYYFWEKGYKIGYAEKAEVYVKNPDNWKEWVTQKTRTSKAHETLEKYVNTSLTPRVKTFKTEAKGIFDVLKYPENFKEIFYTFQLILSRFYMWSLVYRDTRIKNKHYQDAWERIESTK